jgi:hypothetical protein
MVEVLHLAAAFILWTAAGCAVRVQRTSHLLYGVAALLTLAARVMARVSFPAFCAVPEYVFRVKTACGGAAVCRVSVCRSSARCSFSTSISPAKRS